MHHSQEGCSGDVTRQAPNVPFGKVDDEGVSERLIHERDAAIVGGDIGALTEAREQLDVIG
jgi:hypothetical protein